MSDQVAVEYHQPGQLPADEVLVPFELLSAADGRGQEPVTLEPQGSGNVLASWTDHGIPQVIEFDAGPLADSKFPMSPDSFETNTPELREALNLAAMIADNDPHRYALNCLQLRGGEGKIVATDGRQILVQFGFRFPWTDDLLVGASPVFACRELPEAEGVGVGIVDDWVAFKIGVWTVSLRINREGRFPKLDDLFRQPAAATSRMSIAEADAEFLTKTLTRLPSDHEQNNPVTLVVLDVLSDDVAQVIFIEHDEPIQALLLDRLHPTFGVGVLVGFLRADLFHFNLRVQKCRARFQSAFCGGNRSRDDGDEDHKMVAGGC